MSPLHSLRLGWLVDQGYARGQWRVRPYAQIGNTRYMGPPRDDFFSTRKVAERRATAARAEGPPALHAIFSIKEARHRKPRSAA